MGKASFQRTHGELKKFADLDSEKLNEAVDAYLQNQKWKYVLALEGLHDDAARNGNAAACFQILKVLIAMTGGVFPPDDPKEPAADAATPAKPKRKVDTAKLTDEELEEMAK